MMVPPLVSWGCGAGEGRRGRGRRRSASPRSRWGSLWSAALMAALPSGLGAAVLVGAVGVVGLGQLPPAWVVAQQARRQAVGDALLPLDRPEVGPPGHLSAARQRCWQVGPVGLQAKRGGDLVPAAALLAGVAHRLPLPPGQGLDQLAVGAQRLQGSWPLGPLGVPLETRDGFVVALLAGLLEGAAHRVGHRPGIPGLQRLRERVRWQLLGLLVGLGVGGVVLLLLLVVSAH